MRTTAPNPFSHLRDATDGARRFALLEAIYDAAAGRPSQLVPLAPIAAALGIHPNELQPMIDWLASAMLVRQSFGPSHADITALGVDFVEVARKNRETP